MSMDYVVRAISDNHEVRGFAAITTHLVQELVHRHHTLPVASAALGGAATFGAMLSTTLKEERHQITIQVI